MLRLGETKIAKEKIYAAEKPMKIWDGNVDNIISKLVKTKTNSKYLIGYLDKAIRQLIFIISKVSEYVQTFKDKDRYKDKNDKLMFFHIDNEELSEKYKAIWTKI